MQAFTVNVVPRDPHVVVEVRGDVNVMEADHLRNDLRPVLQRKPSRIVLDVSDLQFINSLGLGVLLEFRKDAQDKGVELRLAGARGRIADMLQKTRLVELFPSFKTADEACGC